MEKYCGVCKFDLSLLYCVLILICCFVMIGVNGHIPGGKESEHYGNIWHQYHTLVLNLIHISSYSLPKGCNGVSLL